MLQVLVWVAACQHPLVDLEDALKAVHNASLIAVNYSDPKYTAYAKEPTVVLLLISLEWAAQLACRLVTRQHS